MAQNHISIRKFHENDWQEYRFIRLEALSSHPNYFSPLRDETQFTVDDWKRRLNGENACMFGLYADVKLIGLTGIVRDHTEFEKAHLIASYIRPEYRRTGLSRLFYEARIKWAREQKNIKLLVVDHNQENEPSMRAHQKFGFIFSNSYDEVSSSGQSKKIFCYKLEI